MQESALGGCLHKISPTVTRSVDLVTEPDVLATLIFYECELGGMSGTPW